jgi:hypothetical protein
MSDLNIHTDTLTGWTYTQAGRPVSFVMPLDAPGDATVIRFDNWWNALHFAVTFAHYNGREYFGGPGQ